MVPVTREMEALERRLERLRTEVRGAVTTGDRDRARGLRAELRDAEREWEGALARLEAQTPDARDEAEAGGGPQPSPAPAGAGARRGPAKGGALVPAREQVHEVLTLLGVPSAPRLIVAVHSAFYPGTLDGTRLTSLRRDEERSFRSAPYARPYYLCAALTADLLAPARGLLAVSTWPAERRIIGPLSPRVDYLTAAIRVAERFREIPDAGTEARRLLWRLMANIPHAAVSFRTMSADEVVAAAKAELAIHQAADSELRAAAAARARAQLTDVEQLYGAGLRASRGSGTSA